MSALSSWEARRRKELLAACAQHEARAVERDAELDAERSARREAFQRGWFRRTSAIQLQLAALKRRLCRD